MTISYVDNKNPIIGPKNGSKQEISLYDKELGNRRIISTSPEKIDTFLQNRKNSIDETKKKCVATQAAIAVGSVIPGAISLVPKFIKKASAQSKLVSAIFSASCLAMGILTGAIYARQKVNQTEEKLSQDFINNNK